jgi:hypothetical protein
MTIPTLNLTRGTTYRVITPLGDSYDLLFLRYSTLNGEVAYIFDDPNDGQTSIWEDDLAEGYQIVSMP